MYFFINTWPQACTKQHNCYLCSSMILHGAGRSKSTCFALGFLFWFTYTCTLIWILMFLICSFWDRAELFPKKTLSWSSFALTAERSIGLDDLDGFWALVDLLSTSNLILGVPRENRAEYWYQFIILWIGRAKNRRCRRTGEVYPPPLRIHCILLS